MESGDWEEAYARFRKSSQLVPDNLMFRQCTRGAATKLFEQRRFTVFNRAAQLDAIRIALSDENWTLADRLSEDGLRYFPQDADFNASLSRACHRLGYRDIASYACECAIRADSEHHDAISLAFEMETDFAKPLMKHLLRRWKHLPADRRLPNITRHPTVDEYSMLSYMTLAKNVKHSKPAQPNKRMVVVLSGLIRIELSEPDSRKVDVAGREVLHIPPNVAHAAVALEKTIAVDVLSPPNER